MTEQISECLRIWHPESAVEHYLSVNLREGSDKAAVCAYYEDGCVNMESGARVACWDVTYESPAGSDNGYVWFGDGRVDGDGRIDIEIDKLRGTGLGSLLMLPLVRWAKRRRFDVPVVPIDLQESDAKTEDERNRRNHFYEKLGFTFEYADGQQTYGTSRPMYASELVMPVFKMSRGWLVESLSTPSSVFSAR